MGFLAEGARMVAARAASSVSLVSRALDAAARLQPSLNAFTAIFAETALEAAASADRRAEAGEPLGPLHGVPVAVKDLFDVAGSATSGCCRAYAGRVAASDAPAVEALRRAGAVVIGKTNMHELAFGATNTVSSAGAANNPWDLERVPGGSSGGSSAAVAARIVPAALGSDTGGSVRIPAAFCGVSGLKTTHGLVSLEGVLPLAPSLDTVGPLAVDAEDLALAMRALTGLAAETDEPSVEGIRVGLAADLLARADAGIDAAVRAAAQVLAQLGAEVAETSVEWFDRAAGAWLPIALYEFARAHADLVERPEDVSPPIYALLRHGVALAEADYEAAMVARDEVRAALGRTFDRLDALVAPTAAVTAPRHQERTIRVGGNEIQVDAAAGMLTLSFNVPGAPAIQLPCGVSEDGLPIGMQIVGPRGSEARLLAVGAAYQRATDWHTRVPPHAA